MGSNPGYLLKSFLLYVQLRINVFEDYFLHLLVARAESAKIFLNSFVKMPDYHFPTCFSHKEIARLDFLSCTKWKQIEANSVCSAEESRIGEILCCYSETEQNRARYIQLTFSFYVKWPGEKKLWSSSSSSSSSSSRSVSRTRPGGTYGDGWDLSF